MCNDEGYHVVTFLLHTGFGIGCEPRLQQAAERVRPLLQLDYCYYYQILLLLLLLYMMMHRVVSANAERPCIVAALCGAGVHVGARWMTSRSRGGGCRRRRRRCCRSRRACTLGRVLLLLLLPLHDRERLCERPRFVLAVDEAAPR